MLPVPPIALATIPSLSEIATSVLVPPHYWVSRDLCIEMTPRRLTSMQIYKGCVACPFVATPLTLACAEPLACEVFWNATVQTVVPL